jgi:cyclic-di-GMP phosphodiesterase TipF (flagellum assembly factor)
MRKITTALLFSAYIFIALIAADLVGQGGGGWTAGAATLAGCLCLAFALHGVIAQLSSRATLEAEIEAVREAHRLLADALDSTQRNLDELSTALKAGEAERTEQITSEVRMLEDLVHRMGQDLAVKLSGLKRDDTTSPEGRRSRQAAALLETVRGALADNRVDLYLQPVVSLPQRKTTFYEGFTRLRDETGRILMPAEYLSVAEPEGLVSAIDNLLLFRCVQIVRRLAKQDRKVGIFCNVALASLGDETFFPQFIEFLAENRDMAASVIFELGHQAFESRGAIEARNMAKLADLGFRFSLDKIQTLDFDFQDLQRADVKFLKISADVLVEQLFEVDGRPALKSLQDIHASDFASLTRRWGVEVVAEKVETERQVLDILDLEIGYGQGNLFGEPRAIREQVLAETDPPADFLRSSLRLRRSGGRG